MKLDRDTSHRIVTYVRQDFAPKDSLLCVPDLCNNVLFLMCNPSPRCCIQVVELLKMRRQYQLGGETSSCLKSQPGFVPLGLHPVKVRSLVLVLHKANLVSIHVEKKPFMQFLPSKTSYMIGVESLMQLLPVRFELFPDVTRFQPSAFPLHELFSGQVGSDRMGGHLHGSYVSFLPGKDAPIFRIQTTRQKKAHNWATGWSWMMPSQGSFLVEGVI